jgi:hypothetical protein
MCAWRSSVLQVFTQHKSELTRMLGLHSPPRFHKIDSQKKENPINCYLSNKCRGIPIKYICVYTTVYINIVIYDILEIPKIMVDRDSQVMNCGINPRTNHRPSCDTHGDLQRFFYPLRISSPIPSCFAFCIALCAASLVLSSLLWGLQLFRSLLDSRILPKYAGCWHLCFYLAATHFAFVLPVT